MRTRHYLNLNYLCNERCVFCASDRTNSKPGGGVRQELTLQQIGDWIAAHRPRRADEVLLAGGEPTLHRQLFEIVRAFGAHCRDITLFTNGIKLADRVYAAETIEAGVSKFQIALFGATPHTHDAVTRRPGSFQQTIVALNNLADAGGKKKVVVRLLVARQCLDELPQIVRVLRRDVRGVDEVSINRLILSDKARAAEAEVSWAEASAAINESARLILEYGYEFHFWPVPLCVFQGAVTSYIEREVARRLRRRNVRSELRYLDPAIARDRPAPSSGGAGRARPAVCQGCRYENVCVGVEEWYWEKFGAAGLGWVHGQHA